MPNWMPEWFTAVATGSARSFAIELIRYVVAAGAMSGALWLGAGWAERRRIQLRTPVPAERRHEMVSSVITIGAFTIAMTATIVLLRADIIHLIMTPPPLWLAAVEFVAMAIAHDAYFYWVHRGLHHRRLFRRLHMTHHKSRSPTPWAAYSFAPVEGFLHAAFVPLFLLCVPAFHGFVIMAMLGYEIIRNVIGHSGHEFAWSGFTRSLWTGWITATTHHDLHHSDSGCNFGLYFTWWDRWMGTEHKEYHERFEAAVCGAGRDERSSTQPAITPNDPQPVARTDQPPVAQSFPDENHTERTIFGLGAVFIEQGHALDCGELGSGKAHRRAEIGAAVPAVPDRDDIAFRVPARGKDDLAGGRARRARLAGRLRRPTDAIHIEHAERPLPAKAGAMDATL